jgi:A1 cistron-splicing factor AAR2
MSQCNVDDIEVEAAEDGMVVLDAIRCAEAPSPPAHAMTVTTAAPSSADLTAILIADPPSEGLEFGIDCMCYETGPNFKGVSVVPPGLHLIYFGLNGGIGGGRHGMFIKLRRNEVCVKQWDAVNEELSSAEGPSAEGLNAVRLQLQQGHLNGNLGPYPLNTYALWKNLTNFISSACLNRTGCSIGTLIRATNDEEFVTNAGHSESGQRVPAGTQRCIPCYTNIFAYENELNIASMNDDENIRKHFGAVVTARNIDKSTLLQRILVSEMSGSGEQQWTELLAEVQMSFLLFICLFSYSSLKQWQQLINLICNSHAYLLAKQSFAVAFIRTLYQQLSFAPTDFFAVELSKDNFLGPALTALFDTLDTVTAQRTEPGEEARNSCNTLLLEHRQRLLTYVQKKFGLFVDVEFSNPADDIMANHFEKFILNDDDKPLIVSETESTGPSDDIVCEPDWTPNHAAERNKEMSSAELLAAKYCWRYPLLFAEMSRAKPAEDMIMTAARLLDSNLSYTEVERNKLLVEEARLFIEHECKF